MKNTEIRFNLDGLDDIKAKVGSNMRARVGVLGSKVTRNDGDKSGITNAELMLIQMFGSVTRNIPPRDPLLAPLIKKRRELLKSLATGEMREAFMAGDYKKMFMLLGVKAEEFVQQAFETGGFGEWPKNASSTILAKGSSAPLIDTGELRKSVTSDVVTNAGKSSRLAGA